ncbi:MAG: preprotein translocase subunit SecE [Clostridia bacterium]|nr:preprotein translocase subunit SecE [Clostridia bacterium]
MAKSDKDLEIKGKESEKKEKKEKGKKPGFFARIGIRLKETFSELKRVTWPTLPKALKSTGIVLAFVAVFLVIITAVNIGFTELLQLLTDLGTGA